MAKKSKGKKEGKSAPKLENQGRGDPNPPTSGLYNTTKPESASVRSLGELVKGWFKSAKEAARPEGKFLGVEDKFLDIKDYVDTLDNKKEHK